MHDRLKESVDLDPVLVRRRVGQGDGLSDLHQRVTGLVERREDRRADTLASGAAFHEDTVGPHLGDALQVQVERLREGGQEDQVNLL
jgi:hypothetical protein